MHAEEDYLSKPMNKAGTLWFKENFRKLDIIE